MKLPLNLEELAVDVAIELRRRKRSHTARRDAFDAMVDQYIVAAIDPVKTQTHAEIEAGLRKALRLAKSQLKTIVTDCDMALTDKWDRSEDGFIAMKDNCEKVIAEIEKVI